MSDVRTPESLEATAARLGIGWAPAIAPADVDAGLLARVPLSFSRSNLILPLAEQDGAIRVAVASPAGLLALDELRLTFDRPLAAVLVPAAVLTDAVNHAYAGMTGTARDVLPRPREGVEERGLPAVRVPGEGDAERRVGCAG